MIVTVKCGKCHHEWHAWLGQGKKAREINLFFYDCEDGREVLAHDTCDWCMYAGPHEILHNPRLDNLTTTQGDKV